MAERRAIRESVLPIVDANRPVWTKTVTELDQELEALHQAIERGSPR